MTLKMSGGEWGVGKRQEIKKDGWKDDKRGGKKKRKEKQRKEKKRKKRRGKKRRGKKKRQGVGSLILKRLIWELSSTTKLAQKCFAHKNYKDEEV